VSTGSEQGLLGLAFHPNYASNGYFFVNYTNSAGTTVIARYQVSGGDPNVANPTATPVLTIAQPFANHNGGWMGFGPDGYLYDAQGDGGDFCDPQGNAQNRNVLLGKILRINVDALPYTIPADNPFVGVPNTRGEIWAYGLRNPWRPSFDRETGDLWIADVGQDYMEEVNFQPAAITPPFTAANYGWKCREGTVCSSISPSLCNVSSCGAGCTVLTGPATEPIYTYIQAATSNCSVSGGYVYRGCAMPYLRGTYFFADYCSNQIWSFQRVGGVVTNFTNRTAELAVAGTTINFVVSFAEDQTGEMYIIDQGGGEIYKIIPRCKANCDGSTLAPILNVNDFSCFLNRFAAGECYANCDGSTAMPVLNVNDYSCFLNQYAVGCP
jgi:glucose/arabinose dehydrogenase